MKTGDFWAHGFNETESIAEVECSFTSFESVDLRYSGSNHATVYGNKRDNIMYGSEMDDIFYGEQGDDIFYPGRGFNKFAGGSGFDQVYIDFAPKLERASKEREGSDTQWAGMRFLSFYDHGSSASTYIYEDVEIIHFRGETYTFNELYNSHRNVFKDRSQNLEENRMAGTDWNDDLHGYLGRDILKGKEGSDHFYLENSGQGALNANSDQIIDFRREENDKIYIDASAFGMRANRANIAIVNNNSEQRQALRSDEVDFVYGQHNGLMRWNENGAAGGTGESGGVVTALIESSDRNLSQSDFQFF